MIGKLKERIQGMARKCRNQQEQEAIAIPVADETMRGDVAIRIWSWVYLAGRRTKVEAAWWTGPMEEKNCPVKVWAVQEMKQPMKEAKPKAEQKGEIPGFFPSPTL